MDRKASPQSSMNGLNWKIEHECPQCGAPVILEETDRLFTCAFCRTRLYISATDHLRHWIPPGGANGETVFIPYWRIRGLTYTFAPLDMTGRYIDTSAGAVELAGLPLSLGLRPQAMTLKFVTPKSPGTFLRPTRALHDAMPDAGRTDDGTRRSVFIGESVNLIYTPMFIKDGVLYDAILRRPVTAWNPDGAVPHSPEEICTATRFVATLCPQCGWDLAGEKDALVLTCGNCNSAWICEGDVFRQIPFSVMEGRGEHLVYFPFWRIKPRISGISAASFADFVRLANLPRVGTDDMEKRPLHFWSPAFKVNPTLYLRWSRQMTVLQPEDDFDDRRVPSAAYPVNLAVGEAVENVRVILGAVMTDKRMFYQNMPHIRIDPGDFLLVYHPFVVDRQEFRHEKMGLVMEKNALRFGATM